MQTAIPALGTMSWTRRRVPTTAALGLLLVLGFAQSGFAQSPNGPLNFENNFFVTGDYVVAGAYNVNSKFVTINGIMYTTGTINVPDAKTVGKPGNPGITGATSVPAGAEILAALLYWQTVEKTGIVPGGPGSGQNGFFRPVFSGGPRTGYPLIGVDLMSQDSVAFSSGGCSGGSTGKVVRTYRAPVTGYLPQDPTTGAVLANSTYEVTLPSSGNNTPLSLGATLVIIYRILSPNVPLNSIVIYDGAVGQSNTMLNMKQTMQGFYQADKSPIARLTHIVGSGQSNKYQNVSLNGIVLPSLYGHNAPAFPGYYGTWDNPTWTFPDPNVPAIGNLDPVKENDASATTMVAPTPSNQGCVSWGAVIVSTTVKNTDGDGLLDVWKTNQGYCDASVTEGKCNGPGDPAWVDLTGAVLGTQANPHKDVFVQLDYMCSKVLGPLSCDATGANYSFNPGSAADPVLAPVVTAFSNKGVDLHIVPGNAIHEQTCTDTGQNPPTCPYPGQPGVVGWKGGLIFIQNQLIDPSSGNFCTTAFNPGDCVSVLQPARKDSYHYSLFAHAIGLPNWSLGAATLTSVGQSGTTVTFTTSTPHGLDTSCTASGRVTVAYAITNPNLNGTYCVHSVPNPTTFTIQVANSTSAPYTFNTDPDLEVGSGQAGTVSGFSDVGGQDSLITLGSWGADATVSVKTGTFMHELGHSLGLTHGGFYYARGSYVPTIGLNCKTNYQSVMNYMFQIDLLDPGNGQNVPDYSGQTLPTLDKSAGGTNPFGGNQAYLTSWHGTNTQVGIPRGTPLTLRCDGSVITDGAMVYRVTRPVSLFSWVAGQDINFDGITTTDETFFGYDDWSPTATTTGVDPRQIGATGSLSAAGLVGGGKQFGGGGGKQFGAGGGQQFGAGGGKQFGGGGGKQFGAGGGKQFGAGGGLGDLTQTIANSFTRPPRSLTATEDASARLIHLSWTVPTFGQIGAYRIYRSSDGGHTFALLATVPGTQLTYQDTVTCNRTGYQYYVTAVLLNTTQESVPSNTVATIPPSTNPLTGCYTLSGFSSPASAVHGSLVPITWALTDDFYTTGNPVTNKAANTLVAIGPVPNGCTTGRTTILLNGSPQSGASTFPTPSGTGQFTFNWDTDGFCAGSYTFQLTLDSGQTQTTSALQLQIDVTDTDSTPHISITSLAGATVGVAYNNSITEDGGVGSLIWTVASGSLPSGISLGSSSGKLSGTPCDKPGNYTFTAQVTDSAGNSGTQTLTLNVLAAPVAQINQPLAPESAVPGAPGFAVSVNGTGFDACSAVQWNGSALTTVFKSATQLTTTIPSGDVLNPGTASISVAKTGSPTSNVDFFQITNPTATVYSSAAGVPTAVGHNPKGLISADLIGNGKLDLAVANYGSNSLSIVLGNGDGTFQSAVPYPVGRGPFSVITGDFDGNGKLDLAVANSGDNTVSILLGKGDGTFQSAVPYPVGNGPYSVSTGDFNGDGKLDLAVANQNDHTVSILLGNGDGTFQTHVDSPAGVTNVAGVAVGDFNGDSKLDLAVTNPSTDQVSILLGKGDGTFQTPVSYSTGAAGSNPIAVTAADFNGDGVLDLAVTNLNVETVAIFLGNGNGTFTLKGSYSTTIGNLTGPSAITTGDFDGDGKVDLAITDQSDNSVSILLGNGDGTFQSPLEFNTGNASNLTAGVAAGDFNGDGRLDVVVANSTDGTVSVMLQAPRVQLTPSPLPSFGTVAVSSTSSPPQVVTLTNTGSAALTMSSSGIAFGGTNPGDFSQNNTCPTSPSTLAAGSNCTINVTFAPTQAGARSASLNITDNAFDTPQNVSLSGTGVMAPPTNLTATATSGSGSVSLNWTASTSNTVASYNVYRSTVSGSGYSLIASVSTTSFTDTVTSGTYYYVVTAVDASSHESANSSEATATD